MDSIQFNRVMQYVEGGKKTAKVLIGGKRKGEKGYFVEPTVFTEVADDDPLNKEEIFGPVSHFLIFLWGLIDVFFFRGKGYCSPYFQD